ncbi:hypothetical protein GS399_05345 [Pedobacter sp. HMF7647]|uniref:Peptidase S74 domain-containing protein n=1 Tax=Hufsiella arboris TaxID=2695275 RepID=A0A7K1Y7G9_9SPHI|nr:hypothetical protein [Hufsiella arboris]MXV50390.1 hypothetical protein [Hufsiella arboris]
MKKQFLILACGFFIIKMSVAQTNSFPPTGNVGVGTLSPGAALTIYNSTPVLQIFDHEINPQDGSSMGKLAFGRGAEFASIDITRYQGSFDDVTGMIFRTSWATGAGGDGANLERMRIQFNGNVGIGTSNPTERLSVNGKIRAKEIRVEASPWPDYVFGPEHILPCLQDLEKFIQTNRRLPEIPSAADVLRDGVALGEISALLLKKIEEMTLYMIAKDKQLTAAATENGQLKRRLEQLEARVEALSVNTPVCPKD